MVATFNHSTDFWTGSKLILTDGMRDLISTTTLPVIGAKTLALARIWRPLAANGFHISTRLMT